MRRLPVVLILLAAMSGPATADGPGFRLTSPAFKDGGGIPVVHTCDGKSVSPRLEWQGVPGRARALALIVEDPDAPSGMFVHWVLLNISPKRRALEEGARLVVDLRRSEVMVAGRNGAGKGGYIGPCPPSGTHRYVFRLFALDGALNLRTGATRDQALRAMQGHVLAEARLTGTYRRR
jgi:hypothetical protein